MEEGEALRQHFPKALAAAALGALTFSGTALGSHGFVYDDFAAIVTNDVVLSWKSLTRASLESVFTTDFWGQNVCSDLSHKSYRPLTTLTFCLNHAVSALDARPYHLTNVAIYFTLILVLYFLFVAVVDGTEERNDRVGKVNEVTRNTSFTYQTVPFVASLLFSVHPLHSEAVASVVGRAELLSGLFFAISVWSFLKATSTRATVYIFLSIIACALAAFSKEQGITALASCGALDLIWTVFMGGGSTRTDFLNRSLVIFVAFVGILYLRMDLMCFTLPTFHAADNPVAWIEDAPSRYLAMLHLAWSHMSLLVFPWDLAADWSMESIDLLTWQRVSGGDYARAAAVLGATVFVAVAIAWLALTNTISARLRTLVLQSIAMIVVPFIPASNFFFFVGFVLAERVLFLPSIGFCLLAAVLIVNLSRRKATVGVVTIIAVTALGLRTIARNEDWRDAGNLFRGALRVTPGNAVRFHFISFLHFKFSFCRENTVPIPLVEVEGYNVNEFLSVMSDEYS